MSFPPSYLPKKYLVLIIIENVLERFVWVCQFKDKKKRILINQQILYVHFEKDVLTIRNKNKKHSDFWNVLRSIHYCEFILFADLSWKSAGWHLRDKCWTQTRETYTDNLRKITFRYLNVRPPMINEIIELIYRFHLFDSIFGWYDT